MNGRQAGDGQHSGDGHFKSPWEHLVCWRLPRFPPALARSPGAWVCGPTAAVEMCKVNLRGQEEKQFFQINKSALQYTLNNALSKQLTVWKLCALVYCFAEMCRREAPTVPSPRCTLKSTASSGLTPDQVRRFSYLFIFRGFKWCGACCGGWWWWKLAYNPVGTSSLCVHNRSCPCWQTEGGCSSTWSSTPRSERGLIPDSQLVFIHRLPGCQQSLLMWCSGWVQHYI